MVSRVKRLSAFNMKKLKNKSFLWAIFIGFISNNLFAESADLNQINLKKSGLTVLNVSTMEGSKNNEVLLTLSELKKKIIEINPNIQLQRIQKNISSQGVTFAEGVFQSKLSVDLIQSSLKNKNTAEESLLRSGLGTYTKDSVDFVVKYNKLLNSGADFEAEVSLSSFDTNISQQRRGFKQDDHRTLFKVSITQPLMKNSGSEVTTSKVKIANLEAQKASERVKQVSSSTLAEAYSSYYDLVLAQKKLDMWKQSVEMAVQLLQDSKTLESSGRLSESDILEVESSLLRYQVGRDLAQLEVLKKGNALKTMLSLEGAEVDIRIIAQDDFPEMKMPLLSFEKSLALALSNRNDLKLLSISKEADDLEVLYAKDQLRTRLDLIASYGVNNLETNPSLALSNFDESGKFPTWSIGLKAVIPLGDDSQEKANFNMAELKRQATLLNFLTIKNNAYNELQTSINAIKNSYKGWKLFHEVVEKEQKQFEIEKNKVRLGRSEVRSVLARKERLINAQNAALDQATSFAKALISLEVAQGTILH